MKLGLWIAKSDTSDSKDSKFEYFKNWVITHLMKQEKEENSVCKSLLEYETELNKAFGVGTIRTWKGKKYIKGADKKWRPYYEHNSRGKKMAVAAIVRQINNLQDGDFKGLWNIIKNNKSRFVNEEGKPENEVIALYKMIKDKGAVGSGRLKKENKETRLSLLREDFHKEMKKYVGKEFKNSNFEDDIKANFSGKSITKIESDKAIEKTVANGFTKEQHFEVAKQIKELFEKADKGFYHEDRKSTNEKTGLKRIVRLYADVKLKDNTKAVAYITLRESFENGTKIYTIELMDVKKASENTDAVLDGLTIDNKRNGFLKKKSVHNSSIPQTDEKSSTQTSFTQKGESRWGSIYEMQDGTPFEATKFLMEKKDGFVDNVFEVTNTRDKKHYKVGLVWGDDKTGLEKIITKHIVEHTDFESLEEMLDTVQKVLKYGKVGKEINNKITVTNGKYRIVIGTDKGKFIISAFDKSVELSDKVRTEREQEKKRKELNSVVPNSFTLEGTPLPATTSASNIPQKDEKSRDNQKYIDILTSKGASFDNAKKTVEKIDKIIQSKEYIDIFSWLENKENKIARMMFEDISGQKIGKTKEDLRTALINYIGKEKLLENEYIKTMYDNEDAEKHIRKIFDDFPNIDKHSLLVQYFNLKEKEEKKAFRKLNYYEKELFFIGCRLFKEDIFNRFNNGLIKSLTNGGNTMKDTKLEYYKKKILEHLEKLQKQEKSEIRKSIKNIESQYLFENGCLFPIGAEIELNDYELKKAGYPVGTIREWKGKKYIKVAPGKWRPKYDNESRGAKLSIKALMKKVDACKDSQELLNLVMSNAMRFRDENGRPLDIVKELHNYVNSKNNELETSTKDRKIKQIKKENLSTYGKKRDDHIRNDMKLNSISIPYKEYTPEKTREILSDLQHKKTKILNKEKNIEAYIVANSKAKMTSESAINKSKENGFTGEEHLSAVAKIKELFENSNFVSEEPDRNSDISNEKLDIKRFAIEIEINGKKGFAVLTVQHINGNTSKKVEYDETKNKHNIYSVELKYLTKNNRGFKSSHSTDESEGKTQPRMKGQQLPKGTSSPNDSSIPQSDIKSRVISRFSESEIKGIEAYEKDKNEINTLLAEYERIDNKLKSTEKTKIKDWLHPTKNELEYIDKRKKLQSKRSELKVKISHLTSKMMEQSKGLPKDYDTSLMADNLIITKSHGGFIMNKTAITWEKIEKSRILQDKKLEYFKKKILEHLEKLQKQEKSEIRKSIKNIESQYLFDNGCLFPIGAEIELNDYELKKAGYPVGTIREWKGKKYIKVAPGKWRPKYDNESRGAKLSIKALMKKVDACKDSQELLNLVMSNAMRFRDENGRPLDIVKELHNYVSKKNDEIEFQEDVERKRNDMRMFNGYIDDFVTDMKRLSKEEQKTYIEKERKRLNNEIRLKKDKGMRAVFRMQLKALKRVENYFNEQTDDEKHENRSQAMKGNQNAKKYFTDEIKEKVLKDILSPTEERLKLDYTRENYNKLFPIGYAETPIGKIKLGEHQFERLGEKDNGTRKEYLGALSQALKEPNVIIDDVDEKGRHAKLFIKSFKDFNGNEYYVAITPTIDGIDVVVSNGARRENQILEKIKKASMYYYAPGSQTIGTAEALPNDSSIPQSDIKSSENEAEAPQVTQIAQANIDKTSEKIDAEIEKWCDLIDENNARMAKIDKQLESPIDYRKEEKLRKEHHSLYLQNANLKATEIPHLIKKKERVTIIRNLVERSSNQLQEEIQEIKEQLEQRQAVYKPFQDERKAINKKGNLSKEELARLKEIEQVATPIWHDILTLEDNISRHEVALEEKANALKEHENRSNAMLGNQNAKKDGVENDKPKSKTSKLREELKNNLRPYFDSPIHNKKTDVDAHLSGKSVDKIGSDKAINKSKENGFSVDEHFEVANNIVSLFENADLIDVASDKNNSPDLKAIKRFNCETKLKNGEKVNAYITVKESVEHGHKIYSVEVMDIKKASENTDAMMDKTESKDSPLSADSTIPQTYDLSSNMITDLSQIEKSYSTDITNKKPIAKVEPIDENSFRLPVNKVTEKIIEQAMQYRSTDNRRYFMNGFGIDKVNNVLNATDGRRCITIKVAGLENIALKDNSCVQIEKKGDKYVFTKIDGVFPNCKRVTPEPDEIETTHTIDRKSLLNVVKEIREVYRLQKKTNASSDTAKRTYLVSKNGTLYISKEQTANGEPQKWYKIGASTKDMAFAMNTDYLLDLCNTSTTDTIDFLTSKMIENEATTMQPISVADSISNQIIMPMTTLDDNVERGYHFFANMIEPHKIFTESDIAKGKEARNKFEKEIKQVIQKHKDECAKIAYDKLMRGNSMGFDNWDDFEEACNHSISKFEKRDINYQWILRKKFDEDLGKLATDMKQYKEKVYQKYCGETNISADKEYKKLEKESFLGAAQGVRQLLEDAKNGKPEVINKFFPNGIQKSYKGLLFIDKQGRFWLKKGGAV